MSVRQGYEQLGVEGYYKEHGLDYVNPHIDKITHLLNLDEVKKYIGDSVLDLCCGGGEVTTILNSQSKQYSIDGVDPYTAMAYKKNTGKTCMPYTFKDIVLGKLDNKKYDTIICSFAMHLCELSMLNMLLFRLSNISNTLIILTPHKRPVIKNWWKLQKEIIFERVKLRIYTKI